jgi:methylase of polypeptide subunit release factors
MPPDRAQARAFIAKALSLSGSNESVIRGNLTSYLPLIFPDRPWWVDEHVTGAEFGVRYYEPDGAHRGQVDVVVGRTAIEYESDLRVQAKLDEGHRQIRQYLAGMANDGHPSDQLLGVVSDTLRWYVYRPLVTPRPGSKLGEPDITLVPIEPLLELTEADNLNADRLIAFLQSHLGRDGSRPLSAASLASSLGRDTARGRRHRQDLYRVVSNALAGRQQYAGLIKDLWGRFVAYPGAESFDEVTYADELYLVTLAKLVCANVIETRALISSKPELAGILSGRWFEDKGLDNFVEHDFFGWLTEQPYIAEIVAISEEIQHDLATYDFQTPAAQDLFGELFAQLASASQRILLGQEWTPQWLARQVVDGAVRWLTDENPCFIDMCCGSGAFVVAALEHVIRSFGDAGTGPNEPAALAQVLTAITAFDIDPLAVILTKVNWVITVRRWFHAFDGTYRLPIPVYQADSLFVITGLSSGDSDPEHYELHLLDSVLQLPKVLAVPTRQPFFDELIAASYRVAAMRAQNKQAVRPSDGEAAVASAAPHLQTALSAAEQEQTMAFAAELIDALRKAEERGLNGLWSFILRNSYRPALVRGQFNGIVSNPPWLAMSKLPDNPYKSEIDDKMNRFRIRPSGAAHPHAELATVFLMEAADRYLRQGGVVACILPGTVVNGGQHNNFRRRVTELEPSPSGLRVMQLWQVAKGVFKNRAIVFFGRKGS